MKTRIAAAMLFAATAGAVVLFPYHTTSGATSSPVVVPRTGDVKIQERPRVEVVFVLDTTGSMSGLIEAAKEKIWSIASTMASAQHSPEVRMGLVAYRDRGDAYVTRVTDLSNDLDSMYATLMDFRAQGGGDTPESVNAALHDAVNKITWSDDQDVYKVVFLVGDAPPHMDYQDDVKYPVTLAQAKKRGIVVNAIQSGNSRSTTAQWQQVASLGDGHYFRVEQGGSAVAVATPFDSDLARLSRELDATRLYYGNEAQKLKQRLKVEASEKLNALASVASRARRATFNASSSGTANLLGENELVDDVASGKVALDSIAPAALPAAIREMPAEEQQAEVEQRAKRRDELKRQITELSDKRTDFISKKVEEAGGAEDSLDHKIYSAIREQAAAKGLRYEADAPTY